MTPANPACSHRPAWRDRNVGAFVLGICALLLATSPADAAEKPVGPAFGPRLLHYPLQCHDERLCRIACFQNGVKVAERRSISKDDVLNLVVNAGLSEEIVRQWIEIRAADGKDVQTILLTKDTVCDLQSLSLKPPKLAR